MIDSYAEPPVAQQGIKSYLADRQLFRYCFVYILMKILLFLLALAIPTLSIGQVESAYQFKVDGVSTIEESKSVVELLAPMFDANPTFDDAKDLFECSSVVSISEPKLRAKLSAFGYVLLDFVPPVLPIEAK